jgi:hypothetical protein
MTASFDDNQKNLYYTEEEVQEILQNAIAQKFNNQDKFTYEQVLTMAKELDIPPETLKAAEQDWQKQKAELQQRQAFDRYRWKQLKRNWGVYLIVNAFLITLNLITAGTISWAIFPLIGWGFALMYETWQNYTLDGERYKQALKKWQN